MGSPPPSSNNSSPSWTTCPPISSVRFSPTPAPSCPSQALSHSTTWPRSPWQSKQTVSGLIAIVGSYSNIVIAFLSLYSLLITPPYSS